MAINSGYSVGQPLTGIFPSPIVTNINPTAAKKGEIGQIWINTGTGNAWILAGITAAAGANWVQLVAGGGLIVGNLTVGGNLSVTGTSDFTGDVTTTNDLTVGNDLAVNGISTLTGAVGTGSDLNVGGNLAVTGTSDFTGDITTSGDLAVGIDLTVGGVLGVDGAVNFFEDTINLNTGATTVHITTGTGDPDTVVTAPQGSIFLRTDGAGANEVLYVNTDGAMAWTALT